MSTSRLDAGGPPTSTQWTIERLAGPNALWGANGIAFGPDGRLYVAQFVAGLVSAVDVATGEVEVVVPLDSPVRTPDDLAFAADGTMYIADLAPGRVWGRTPDGEYRLVCDDVVVPNGITCVGDRLFVNEMRSDGRLLELFPNGDPPVVLTADLNWGNAMQAGPDGHLYYPHMLSQQVWRISPDGGTPELVANDVDAPVAVRFDRDGVLYVLSLRPDGLITRIDLTSGDRSTFVTGIAGLDNAAFDDDNRMYVSSFARSGVTEMRPDGGTRPVVRQGLVGPFGITVGGDGTVYAADHFSLAAVGTDGTDPRTVDLVSGGLPAFVHGVASGGDILHLTTTAGEVHGYDTAARKSWARATGLGELTGIAAGPDGDVVVAATGTGRVLRLAADDTVTVLADGLDHPVGVAVAGDGACYVSDDHRGRITNLTTGQTVAEDLGAPQGIAIIGDTLYAIDVRDRRLLAITDGKAVVVAENLPVIHRTEPTTAVAVGRPSQFADLTVTPDGSLLMSANGEGSLLRLS